MHLHMLNSSFDITQDIVLKAQHLLNAWNEALKFTGGDLKLSKCFWTLHDYSLQDSVCTCIELTSNLISIIVKNSNTKIKHTTTDRMIILVGVPIKPYDDSHDAETIYQDKTKDRICYFKSNYVRQKDIFF